METQRWSNSRCCSSRPIKCTSVVLSAPRKDFEPDVYMRRHRGRKRGNGREAYAPIQQCLRSKNNGALLLLCANCYCCTVCSYRWSWSTVGCCCFCVCLLLCDGVCARGEAILAQVYVLYMIYTRCVFVCQNLQQHSPNERFSLLLCARHRVENTAICRGRWSTGLAGQSLLGQNNSFPRGCFYCPHARMGRPKTTKQNTTV